MERLAAHILLVDLLGLDLGGRYIAEAEHMEGLGYWAGFTPDELRVDAILYRDNVQAAETL